MKFVSTLKDSDVNLDDVNVEFDVTGTTLNGVIIRDMFGGILRVRYTNYAIVAEIPAPKETKKIWKLTATFKDAIHAEPFDTEYEAREAARPYSDAGFETSVDEVEVEE